jgi:hypothetical protein
MVDEHIKLVVVRSSPETTGRAVIELIGLQLFMRCVIVLAASHTSVRADERREGAH